MRSSIHALEIRLSRVKLREIAGKECQLKRGREKKVVESRARERKKGKKGKG